VAYAETVNDVDIDLLAASLRSDSSDLGAFVESLAAKLEEVLPGRVTVDRRRRGLRGPKEVRKIAIDAGDQRLELDRGQGDSVNVHRCRISGGIVLKREQLDTEGWLRELGAAISTEAQRSELTRQALERLLIN
jgi:hypothetical protein